SPEDRSSVLDAFLDVVRANCPVVGASLDRRLGPRSEAAG
ncbi:LysR family transcriptional regulator, partial [Streptomyces sp. CAI-78]|nr:LysR family transcriptional regulator [Streptomyces sp. CAI-78]